MTGAANPMAKTGYQHSVDDRQGSLSSCIKQKKQMHLVGKLVKISLRSLSSLKTEKLSMPLVGKLTRLYIKPA